jgi:cephalosporin-C deacetylase
MRRAFKPSSTRPEDFDVFWDSTRDQLWRIEPEIERQPVETADDTGVCLEVVSFVSLGRVRVSAYSLRWQDDVARPLVISSHGYGSQCRPRWDWANRGVNVLAVDIRGFGISRDALPHPSRWGYVITGIESPETSVIRLAVCDYMQAARVGRMLLDDRVSRCVFEGVSFAGGLALMAQAVTADADLLAIGVPTFGWAEGRNLFVKAGSGAEISSYVTRRPDLLEDTMVVLRYFDAVNFADRIHCPTLLALGLEDDVVPAKTVYGIANNLAAPYELMEFPVSHSNGPEEEQWEQFEGYWLRLALQGVPTGFGGHG